ncbi:hypothetical protein [Poseidonibacter ostreae]|jgi:hypothetical protein|uniref:Restriction endonuclease n=1 Tax=Poseidonibacter ostreae TaxID=2654171 RepID=A0A6L4WSR4_9BACT|nr:hypothetical protein [Poseidonibacter ostreae]KAB7887775.1 hypothetical protein GBG19_10245 [Poseidonibacter ostreae]KAB7888234.1 hypothetical protein GA417_00160 [Poseidonibacter ostreae]KAB7890962.1 hypothetical protein GBG18_07810 [Poseidonibacter ostreae]
MVDTINNYFNNYNFDIKVTKNARFMDQKVTPDVMCMIADCVLNFIETKNDENIKFSSTDIWKHEYSNTNIKEIFGKTDVSNKKAKNEYDKFFQQPLKALAYAKILKEEKQGNKIYFTVLNLEILEYIAIKERNTLNFLDIYLKKVLEDSHIWHLFENFFINNTKDNFTSLKSEYEKFIILHTPINGEIEVRRIFTKILNPLSFKRQKHGTSGGFFSKDIISNDVLMYNRKNWRDITKNKSETREEYEIRAKLEVQQTKDAYVKYTINKATNIVRKLHSPTSEVKDELAIGEATQVHHIFMKSEYPQIESYIENLILLTATQHNTKAHPSNNTRNIHKDYQLLCLLAKSDSIEKYYNTYSKEDFLFVLKIGLNKEFSNKIEFGELKEKLVDLYNVA